MLSYEDFKKRISKFDCLISDYQLGQLYYGIKSSHINSFVRLPFDEKPIDQIDDVYVEPNICESIDEFPLYGQERKIFLINPKDILLNKYSIITGKSGIGKTILLKYLLKYIISGKSPKYLLPFYIQFQQFQQEKEDGEDFFNYAVRVEIGNYLPVINKLNALKELIHQLKDSIIFINNNFLVEDISFVESKLKRLYQQGFSWVFSINYFDKSDSLHDYKKYNILEFNNENVGRFSNLVLTYKFKSSYKFIDKFLEWVNKDPNLFDLCKNPFFLSLVCYLKKDSIEPKSLVKTTDIMTKYIDLIIPDLSMQNNISKLIIKIILNSKVNKWKYYYTDIGELPLSQPITKIFYKTNKGVYTFTHHLFEAYFIAKSLFLISKNELDDIFKNYSLNSSWNIVWAFYSGLCKKKKNGEKYFKELINYIAKNQDLFNKTKMRTVPWFKEFGRIPEDFIQDVPQKALEKSNTYIANQLLELLIDSLSYYIVEMNNHSCSSNTILNNCKDFKQRCSGDKYNKPFNYSNEKIIESLIDILESVIFKFPPSQDWFQMIVFWSSYKQSFELEICLVRFLFESHLFLSTILFQLTQ